MTMLPIGPLMIEHRLIERAVPLMKKEIKRIDIDNSVDCEFILSIVDFFRTYADRCHHGKEEDILFRELEKKNLKPEHKKILDELVSEHVFARETVGKLIKARAEYLKGSKNAIGDIKAQFSRLIELYPEHIAKEDKRFFIPIMDYFSSKEKEQMLDEMRQFDMKLIHEKYGKMIQSMERG
jgi:hemerythrin-like domain-containing protein